jgi:hypothetical protein
MPAPGWELLAGSHEAWITQGLVIRRKPALAIHLLLDALALAFCS